MSARLLVPLVLAGGALWALALAGACVVVIAFSVVPGHGTAGAWSVAGAPSGGAITAPRAPAGAGAAPSPFALADIPPLYLALYRRAAARFGLDWTILAGIGRVECDHGRDPDPACTVEGHFNYAGAGGPAQFLVSTWQRYGISATAGGTPDMWNPADAIMSMANYLRASGAPGDYPDAIYAYNHAWWYVADVLRWASIYTAAAGGRRTASAPVRTSSAAAFSGAASPATSELPSDVIRRSHPEGSA